MATVTHPPRRTKAQLAESLGELLSDEPQSGASLARQLGYKTSNAHKGPVSGALDMLQSRGKAKYIPHTPGSVDGGWVDGESKHAPALVDPMEVEFDYDLEKKVPFAQMFVDESYQRPLTSLVKAIARDFNPYLFGTLMLSDRGKANKPARFAIIDGQTRWAGGGRAGVQAGPAQIFKNLTPEDEADIFWRTQKQRKGMVSWHRFRAQMRSGDKTSIAIFELAKSTGYTLGEQTGHLRSMAALEKTFAQDDFLLERTLGDLHEAWPDAIPEGAHILGLHFFFRHFPLDQRVNEEVDDERLVARLRVTGPDGLHRKASAAKEVGGRGTSARWMAMAIQSAYLSGGRSR